MPMMTMRERMLALAQGKPHDRVPFVMYDRQTLMPTDEVWQLLGRENMGLLQWQFLHTAATPNCQWEAEDYEKDGERRMRRVLHTPVGDLHEERIYEPAYNTTAIAEHLVKTPDDYTMLAAYLRDTVVGDNYEAFQQTVADLGEDGLPHTAVLRTPYQQLWVEWVCIEDLALHMVECPDVVEEVVALMRDVQHRVFEVVCAGVRQGLPIPYIDFPDNITAPVIGRANFRAYCMPDYRELIDMLAETGKDVPVFVHMDGDLKPLWQEIGESGVRGMDSMSPPPDNDTSVADALRLWPEMRVCINFPSSVHIESPERVYETTTQILEEGGRSGRLQIQISENVPTDAWRTSLPAIAKALQDFDDRRA